MERRNLGVTIQLLVIRSWRSGAKFIRRVSSVIVSFFGNETLTICPSC